MDLSTNYMGLSLKNPLVVSPSPLCQEIDNIRKMEDSDGGFRRGGCGTPLAF